MAISMSCLERDGNQPWDAAVSSSPVHFHHHSVMRASKAVPDAAVPKAGHAQRLELQRCVSHHAGSAQARQTVKARASNRCWPKHNVLIQRPGEV